MNTLSSTLRLTALASLLALTTGAAMAQAQQEGPWLLRLRGTYLDMVNKSDPIGGVGASDRISVNSKWIPEFDVSYFFTPNIATELVLTVPQKQDVSLDGNRIGTFKHLPPTLLVQYHFMPQAVIRPYVGAGVNFTRIWDADIAGGTLSLSKWSVQPALQVGADYQLTRNWYLNADIKKVWLSADVKSNGTKVSEVRLDPWLYSIGVGYRF
ncbi:MAG: OmpW family outer membrane protein [Rhodocyclaceae bacterium]